MKVYMGSAMPFGGISQVVNNIKSELVKLGVEFVNNEADADLVHAHAGTIIDTNKPYIVSNHGLYWADLETPYRTKDINADVIENIRRADTVIAPSEFVKRAIGRGAMKDIRVIYHGVNREEMKYEPNRRDVVFGFAKSRIDPTCNIEHLYKLAQMLPDYVFLTTVVNGEKPINVRVVGLNDHETHIDYVAKSTIYLSLVPETGDIGAMEAMACGVPVIGWDVGVLPEIVENGVSGYVVEYGNYKELADKILHVRHNLNEFTKSTYEYGQRFDWAEIAKQYYDVYVESLNKYKVDLSIIVTSYNLQNYIQRCLRSLTKIRNVDYEVIVVDDCSQDRTYQVVTKFCSNKDNFHAYQTPVNVDVSMARNFGYSKSKGKYILFIDGDDVGLAAGIEELYKQISTNPQYQLVYGSLMVNGKVTSNWPKEFNWKGQMAYMNQLPYCTMMKSVVYKYCLGMRSHYSVGEDADFWCRATSYAGRAAQVTRQPTISYTVDREDSKTALSKKDSRWSAWYPFRLADNLQDSYSVNFDDYTRHETTPFLADEYQGAVRSYSNPKVTVVIACGYNHRKYLPTCLDSLLAQSFGDWECVVVFDDDKDQKYNEWQHNFARYFYVNNSSPAKSRNYGVEQARGEYVMFVDADDYLVSGALEALYKACSSDGKHLAYGNYYEATDDSIRLLSARPPLRTDAEKPRLFEKISRTVVVMYPKSVFLQMGGFDTSLDLYEDWDMEIKSYAMSICAIKVDEPIFVYRTQNSTRRFIEVDRRMTATDVLLSKWREYRTNEVLFEMGCLSCGSGGTGRRQNNDFVEATASHKKKLSPTVPDSKLVAGQRYIRYVGGQITGTFTVNGPVTNAEYRFAGSSWGNTKEVGTNGGQVHPDDALALSKKVLWSKKQYRIFVHSGAQSAPPTIKRNKVQAPTVVVSKPKVDPPIVEEPIIAAEIAQRGDSLVDASIDNVNTVEADVYQQDNIATLVNESVSESLSTDVSRLTISEIRKYLVENEFTADQYALMIASESSGQRRKGAIAAIKKAMRDS